MLNSPSGVAVDGAGILYIVDLENMRIRRVDKNGVISTVAGNGRPGFSGDGGPATRARLRPNRVAVDRSGALYVADAGNHRIRKIDTRGIITTVAGNGRAGFSGDGGPATRASLDEPWDVAVSDQGALYIADPQSGRIRAVAPNGVITTVAGSDSDAEFTGTGGPATSARLDRPVFHSSGIALDSGGTLYILEQFAGVRKLDHNGIITGVATGPGAGAGSFAGIAVDAAGAIYFAGEGRIRKIDTQGTITPVAGNGTFRASGDGGPATSAGMIIWGIAVDRTGALFIADNGNNRVRKVDANGIITTVAGNGTAGSSGDGGPATRASVGGALAVAVDGDGVLYIAQSSRIRKVDRNGVISTVAGNGTAGFSGDGGPATSASLDIPVAVAVDGSGNIYIAERNNRVRKVDASGIITTVAGDGVEGFRGDGGPAIAARLHEPVALAVTSGGTLYISDWGNRRVRMVSDRR
jgi:sugar lactone lactonase YvrE